jgi:hypothetical protein
MNQIIAMRGMAPQDFVMVLMKMEFPKNEAARLFLAAVQDMKDGGKRVDALIDYYEYLNGRKENCKLARIKNETFDSLFFNNAKGSGNLELKSKRTITGLLDGDLFHMIEGFSTVTPRTINLASCKGEYSITLLRSLKWNF